MRYLTGSAFRRALEDRLLAISTQESIPLLRLRKMVAFDRFLARMVLSLPNQWVVKGGLALQLRLGDHARTTKDIDLTIIAQNLLVYPALTEAAALALGDWFSYRVAQPSQHTNNEFDSTRYSVQTFLDSRTFERFHLDVGIGDPIIEPIEHITFTPYLEFADLMPTRVPSLPLSQQVAEKLHAYTRPRKSGDSSRAKDLIDILLIAQIANIHAEVLTQAVQATFEHSRTHPLPTHVTPPPENWVRVFANLVTEVGLNNCTLEQAYTAIQQFLDPLLRGQVDGKLWQPQLWAWKSVNNTPNND